MAGRQIAQSHLRINSSSSDDATNFTSCNGASQVVNQFKGNTTSSFTDSTSSGPSPVEPPNDSLIPSDLSPQPSSTTNDFSFVPLPPALIPEPPIKTQKHMRIQVFSASATFVTFDNNASGNSWSFHAGSSDPHITELFKVQISGSTIEIFGTTPPLSPVTQWILTVTEDSEGVATPPRFRPQNGGRRSRAIVHTQFTREDNRSSSSALSFTTINRRGTLYLVPDRTTGEIGLSSTRSFPFQLGEGDRRAILKPEVTLEDDTTLSINNEESLVEVS